MRMSTYRHADERSKTWMVTITDSEYAKAIFTEADYQVLRECEGSDSIADKLLALELIVRRVEESK